MGSVVYSLQMRPLSLRERKELIQDHTPSEWKSLNQDLCQTWGFWYLEISSHQLKSLEMGIIFCMPFWKMFISFPLTKLCIYFHAHIKRKEKKRSPIIPQSKHNKHFGIFPYMLFLKSFDYILWCANPNYTKAFFFFFFIYFY